MEGIMKGIDKYRGCLIGGAAGDALGYAVEFLDYDAIISCYGANGIAEYDLHNGVAEISDDTQMTLFTATGLLLATTRGMTRGIMGSYPGYIHLSYRDWYRTQTERYPLNEGYHYSWLVNVPELFHRRAPGNTCLSALKSFVQGTIDKPLNNSKGCGGVMRVAPIGLYFKQLNDYSSKWIDRIGAETAALTHGHPLGYIPAAALVHIVQSVTHNDGITLKDAVLDMLQSIEKQFPQRDFLNSINHAVALAESSTDDLAAIRQLGYGWVAEETLAIAIYCALKYSDNFDRALIAAVNHDGDSDSTGAVTGNILGAYLGLKEIPQKYLDKLELKDIILEIADDLYHDCKMEEYGDYYDQVWVDKYMCMTYPLAQSQDKATYSFSTNGWIAYNDESMSSGDLEKAEFKPQLQNAALPRVVIKCRQKSSGTQEWTPTEFPCFIGRDTSVAKIVVPDAQMSKVHAKLYIEQGAVMVSDENSSNGTFVNGERISFPAELLTGDEVRIGGTTFFFEVSE